MAILSVTARRQVTLSKEVLRHLGVNPGSKIEIELLSGARGIIKAVQPSGTMDSFIGLLAGRTTKVGTLEEIEEASARGWSGET